MDIFKELIKYQVYRVSVAVYDNLMVLTAEFPDKWTVESNNEYVMIKEDSTQKQKYYFLTSLNNSGHDKLLFETFESVIQMNTEYEDKIQLFKDYVEKMKSFFEEKSLNELRTMEFKFKSIRKSKKKENKKEENVVD